jgi:predicted small secreted protein
MKQLKIISMIILVALAGFLLAGCNAGGITGVGPEEVIINISTIPGVIPPSIGQTPKTTITETPQYTGTITWSPEAAVFEEGKVYTATITLSAKSGYTLEGVGSNFFTVAGAAKVSNKASLGIVTVEFPAAAFGVICDPDNGEEYLYQNIQMGEYAAAPTGVKKYIDSIDINSINTAGLYIRQLTLVGWYKDGAKFDFSAPITENTILKAKWSDIPTPISSVAANDIAAAVTYIKSTQDEYLLLLNADVNCEPQTFDVSDVKLVLAGIGGERKINLSSNGVLFTLGAGGKSGIEIILGNNITLVGRTSGVNGATENNDSNLVLVQNGASLTMLAGSKITGNTSSSPTTWNDAAVRVTDAGSSFTMRGGSITGNAGVGNSADVYIDNMIGAFDFKLAGSAQIGTLTLNASASTHAYPVIVPGWAGSVNKLNLRGSSPSVDTTKTYWEEKIIIEADGSYILTTADIGKFNLGNFISALGGSNNSIPISDSHYVANSGWLLKNGTGLNVLLSKNGGSAKEYIYLSQALDSISEPGNYTVTLKTDFELAPRTLKTSGVKITLIGADTEKKINLSQNGSLFTLGENGKSGIELTLGKNITLVGRTNGVNGAAADNSTNLVIVHYGASLTMLTGSKITGNTMSSRSSRSSSDGFGASVRVTGVGSSFKMQGGMVSGNTGGNGKADVCISANASGLVLSGDAQIEALILCATSSTVYSSATIASGWTGSINKLDLGSNSSTSDTTISYWLHREMLKGAEGYTITSADVAKIIPGDFLFIYSPYTQSISDTHYLYSTGQLFENGTVHTVWVSRNSGRNLGYPDLTRALLLIQTFKFPGNYTVTMVADQTVEPPNPGSDQGELINTGGVNITFIGEGGEKKISLITRAGYMFSVSKSNVALTLGNNITLVGLSANGNGGMDNTSGVVEVKEGASFTMLPGSKITGNTATGRSYGAAVRVSYASFTMKGGEITGNAWIYNSSTIAGGVFLYDSSLIMEGGRIAGNTGYNGIEADVFKYDASEIVLSGDAQIGTLVMYSNSADPIPPVTIASGWIGGAKLNLYINSSDLQSIIDNWVDTRILQPASGYTLTTADINKVTLGLWVSTDASINQAITAHKISDAGVIVPK